MHAATAYNGPVYLRLTRDPSPVITPRDRAFEIGRAYLLREGSDVTLISTGVQAVRTLEAADLLQAEGISAHVLHVPTLKPLDEEAITEAARRTGCVVTAEDHSIIGGLGGAAIGMLTSSDTINLGEPAWRHTASRRHHSSKVARNDEKCTTRDTATQRVTTCTRDK